MEKGGRIKYIRPRNRWQDEVRENGRIVGREGWQDKVHNREESKNLLRMARNCHILHVPMEWNSRYYTWIVSRINILKTNSQNMIMYSIQNIRLKSTYFSKSIKFHPTSDIILSLLTDGHELCYLIHKHSLTVP